tara:strand:+ start:199 stop:786 length:588 start_codon:yes stop_codon:yes gene_type:complete
MRIFFIFLVLIFSHQSWVKADDISEFEIDEMRVGVSLLKYYSKSEIKNQLPKMSTSYTSDKIKRIFFNPTKDSKYFQYNFHFINDGSYQIVELKGGIFYENKKQECYKKMLSVSKDIEESIKYISKDTYTFKHTADKTGKSIVKRIALIVNGGQINISCFSWGKEIKEERPWRDTLQVSIATDEYMDWIRNEAYN